jgi:hypothetical protein
MPYVNCSCGAEVRVTQTANGWRADYGGSFTLHCEELRGAIDARDKADGRFNCGRLDRIIAERMRPHR